MNKWMVASAALILAAQPGAALAQDGAALDCPVLSASADQRAAIGNAMIGATDDATRDDLFRQLSGIVEKCATEHGIAKEQQGDYFDYSLARASREWLAVDLGKVGMSPLVVDKALDFGPGGTNPDLSEDMSEPQILKIVQAYTEEGIDIDKVESGVWEKVGAYAAATSIYWRKRKLLPH
ncbi:MAG: hypothetical protein U0S50_12690 [Sphingopyxis sp.]|uniref:hypothetical protein n=1 Tax=Sphingopyxis sp. TaxID=1908224 RepID=UPI002ABC2165|nr:hypothetical protein [Sphingopyxis sp.]MDZ3832654.1 hypothetical protein [Sphingopyxis sp.]